MNLMCMSVCRVIGLGEKYCCEVERKAQGLILYSSIIETVVSITTLS